MCTICLATSILIHSFRRNRVTKAVVEGADLQCDLYGRKFFLSITVDFVLTDGTM